MLVADSGGVRMKDALHVAAVALLACLAWVGKWIVIAYIFKWVIA